VLGATWAATPAQAQDADGDGVRDIRDRCPATAVGTRVDRAGCDAFCEAATVGEGEFIRTRLIEVGGGGAAGAFGTAEQPPMGWHARTTGNTHGLGFVADPLRSGWTNYVGDFFIPGTPEELFGINVDGTPFNNSVLMSTAGIAGDFVSTDTSCVPNVCGLRAGARMRWVGTATIPGGTIRVEQTSSIVTEGFYILMEVVLTNATSAPHTVVYMRNVDPDNMVTRTGSYDTTNTIVSQGTGVAGVNAIVTATTPAAGTTPSSFLALGSADPDARVTIGGFSNRNALDVFSGTGGLNGMLGATSMGDTAVSIAVRKVIPAGGSVRFAIVYTLTPPAITEAIGCTIPAECGNRALEGAEGCDDGNTRAGDGCSTTCDVEDGWTCTEASPSVCRMLCRGPADCNDGNPCTSDICDLGDCRNPVAPAGTVCPTGVCLGTSTMCVACVDNSTCAGATPFCNTATNACVACLNSSQCNDGNDCTTDACAANRCTATANPTGSACTGGVCNAARMCVECVNDTTCSGSTPFCNVAANRCVQCTLDAQCGAANVCRMNTCTGVDSDGDGVPDTRDADADNDGITDIVEGGGVDASLDSDGDRIPDYLDANTTGRVDANSDGVDDRFDADLDGVPNFLDLDSDNDGIPDTIENGGANLDADRDGRLDSTTDADADGLVSTADVNDASASEATSLLATINTDTVGAPDFLSLDADGDGLFDLIEAGGLDADANGKVDGFTDGNGNGLAALVDPDESGMPLATPDTDRDSRFNFQDVDDDGDSIPTRFEAADANADGVPVDARDSDGDLTPDYLDADDDGDGVATRFEAPDANGDGNPDDARNSDMSAGDGSDMTPDYLDTDDDGDGLLTSAEAPDANTDLDPADALDTDLDLTPNYLDPDDDGDNISTRQEAADGAALTPPAIDLGAPDDDITPHWLDNDSDGDGVLDLAEGRDDLDMDGVPNYLDANSSPRDTDMDGIRDDLECPGMASGSMCPDTDEDGMPDFMDPDDDGDGVPTRDEAPIGDTDGDGTPNHLDTDDDGDSIPTRDERPMDTSVDTDEDMRPNFLDADDDNDGIPTLTEVRDGMMFGNDVDMDGNVNWLDTNADGEGAPDMMECATPASCADTDGDGTPDYLDGGVPVLDTDMDGVPDSVECASMPCRDTDMDGTPDFQDNDDDGDSIPTRDERPGMMNVDSDMDGIPDFLDADDDNDGIPTADERPGMRNVDTDMDGTPNHLDSDDDNDGIPTRTEVTDSTTLGSNDVDRDGNLNWLDTTSDNDAAIDMAECAMAQPSCPDTDGDGTPDYLDDGGDVTGGISGGACGCTVNTTRSTSGILAMLGMLGLVTVRRRRKR
jgi:cysteine-rich repeat protein